MPAPAAERRTRPPAPRTGRRRSTVKLSRMPSSMAPISVPGRLPSPPSTQIANTRPIYSRPTDGSTGWMTISSAPAIDAGRDRDREGGALDARRRRRPSAAARAGPAPRAMMARPMKVLVRKSCSAATSASATRHGTSMRSGRSTKPIFEARPDIGRLHVAVVDAEHQHQRDLGDEQQAEEEREPAQRILAALLERRVVDLIDQRRRAHRTPAAARCSPGSDRRRAA